MGKGPERRKEDFVKVQKHWGDINWDEKLILCVDCGQSYKRVDRDKYMKQDKVGDWVCKKCNYN